MNDDRIDPLLADLRRRPLPPAPDLRSAVRAEIRRRQNTYIESATGLWEGWLALLGQRRVTLVASCLAIGVGVLTGASGYLTPAASAEQRMARATLGLDVFDPGWSSIPTHAPAKKE